MKASFSLCVMNNIPMQHLTQEHSLLEVHRAPPRHQLSSCQVNMPSTQRDKPQMPQISPKSVQRLPQKSAKSLIKTKKELDFPF